MKQFLCVTAAAMLLSLPALANTSKSSSMTPSSGVKTEETTSTKSSTTTLPTGEKMHQDTTTTDSTKIEAQEDSSIMDDSSSHMHSKPGATSDSMKVEEE